MKSDVLLYEKIYQILKNKIECGLLPAGAKLPSRAKLCEEFGTSEKTVRRAVAMLEQDGLVETVQRKRPAVCAKPAVGRKNMMQTLQRAESGAVDDLLKTGILLCYPLNRRGMELCQGREWEIPEAIVAHMNPTQPVEFWQLSNRLWRFFIARNENEFTLRVVDSLGFSEAELAPGTSKLRQAYHANLQELLDTMKHGGNPERVRFDDLFRLYRFPPVTQIAGQGCRFSSASLLHLGAAGLETRFRKVQERYSSVALDLLGLIAAGRYRPGDRLPSHVELQQLYKVSVDTTVKAVRTLQNWGVVTVTRGKGIFVAMDLASLKKLRFDPESIACFVRRFLDSLELLSVTVEGVAVHVAAAVTPPQAQALQQKIECLWNEEYLYQLSPTFLLDFLTEHIRYDALRAIYGIIQNNYHAGRGIPQLVDREKTAASWSIYRQCRDAAACLAAGDGHLFAQKAAAMFRDVQRLVELECRRLNYWGIRPAGIRRRGPVEIRQPHPGR